MQKDVDELLLFKKMNKPGDKKKLLKMLTHTT